MPVHCGGAQGHQRTTRPTTTGRTPTRHSRNSSNHRPTTTTTTHPRTPRAQEEEEEREGCCHCATADGRLLHHSGICSMHANNDLKIQESMQVHLHNYRQRATVHVMQLYTCT